jgi:hypothetical protein
MPVLGLNLSQSATIQVSVENFPNYAKHDRNFKLQIVPSQLKKIYLDNTYEQLEFNADQVAGLHQIDILAEEVPENDNLFINAYIPAIDQTVGAIEYYCKEKVSKEIKLVYVKCADETSYPDLSHEELQNYLNTKALSQLFLDITIDAVQMISQQERSVFESHSNQYALNVLLGERYGELQVPVSEAADEVYFITKIDQGSKPGLHFRGKKGGIQFKKPVNSPVGEFDITAHELGHWLGFIDTWNEAEEPPFDFIIAPEGETNDNFMDYVSYRKTWFKVQLLNMKLNHNDDE